MKSICSHPGCGQVIAYGSRRCSMHPYQPAQKDVDKYYKSTAWRKLRAAQLRLHPICIMCADRGVTKVADTADHIIPRTVGGADNMSNLQSLCRACHTKKSHIDGSLKRGK